VRWPEGFGRARIFEACNEYAGRLLAMQKQYAGWSGLEAVKRQVEALEVALNNARERGGCLLSLGWGSGLLAKSAWLDTSDADYRAIVQNVPLYSRALSANLPFPKTRRVIFLNNKPATLPGWAMLEAG
jgi:CRISPR-associated protein Csm5